MAPAVAARWRRFFLATFGLLTLVSVVGTLVCVGRSYSNVPWRDEWVHLAEYERVLGGESIWRILWSPHYGHRLPITRLTVFGCMHWLHFYRWPLLVLVFTWQAVLYAVLALLAHRVTKGDPEVLAAALIPVTHLVFSPLQMENFVWGVQVHFVASYALPILAMWLLARLRPAAAMVCAAIATYYFATGLAAWPALLLEAAMLGLRRRTVATVAITGAVIWGTYLIDYQYPGGGLGPAGLLWQPWDALRLAVTVAGGPLTNHNLGAGMAAGAILLGLSVYYLRHSSETPSGTVVRSAIAFLWFAILLMVAGRLTMPAVTSRGDYLILPSRYLTPGLLLAGVLWIAAVGERWRRWPLVVTAATVFGYTYAQMPYEVESNRAWIALFQRMDAAANGFLFDVYDGREQDAIWPDRVGLPGQVGFLRRERLGPFAEPRALWAGSKRQTGRALAVELRTEAVRNGFRVTGPRPNGAPRDLLLVNEAGEVIGAVRRTADGYLGYAVERPVGAVAP